MNYIINHLEARLFVFIFLLQQSCTVVLLLFFNLPIYIFYNLTTLKFRHVISPVGFFLLLACTELSFFIVCFVCISWHFFLLLLLFLNLFHYLNFWHFTPSIYCYKWEVYMQSTASDQRPKCFFQCSKTQ